MKSTSRKTHLNDFDLWLSVGFRLNKVAAVVSKRPLRPSGVCYYVGGKMRSGK